MNEVFTCPEGCGKTTTTEGYMRQHLAMKHGAGETPESPQTPEAVEDLTVTPVKDIPPPLPPETTIVKTGEPGSAPSGSPALIAEWKQNPQLRTGLRSLLMLRPICRICQGEDNAQRQWYLSCRHDPYVTVAEHSEPVTRTEPEVVNGKATGRMRVTSVEDLISYKAVPNAVGIELSMGSNSGQGPRIAMAKGYIMPSWLRSPTYPNGIADACEYVNCKKQTDLRIYNMQTENGEEVVGRFCRKEEAQLVWYHKTGNTLEVGEWSPEARQNRSQMLAAAQVS